ncbi:dihydropteroate synthase [Treponema sp. HNW]|uniref:dihydropteroate synthase n=1 Tax=Treponema sp. HNW TaxID=3116654 RepID=UPI003D146D74
MPLPLPPPIPLANRILTTEKPAYIMSIVNCTPDSFWELSRSYSASRAAESALEHFEAGADIVDIGGESSRPGSDYVSADEQTARIVPVIEEIRRHSMKALSVDTRLLSVMEAARQAGADILNDISALEDDKNLASFAASEKIPVILMHKRGTPLIMQDNTDYTDVVRDIASYLSNRIEYAVSEGIEPQKIIVDPGVGFGKDMAANISLIRSGDILLNLIRERTGIRIEHNLMGLSRKTVIGEITGKETAGRLAGSLAAHMIAVQKGYTLLRVHDTSETADMLRVLDALGG